MIQRKNYQLWIAAFLILAILLGVQFPVNRVEAAIQPKATYTILEGTSTKCLPAIAKTKGITYTYQSGNKKIAMVHKNTGVVTGIQEGESLIKVTKTVAGGKSTSSYYKVIVVSLKIKGDTTITCGKSSTYKTNAVNIKATWDVTDESIATIHPVTGELKAISPGKVSIVASYKECISVKEVIVEEVNKEEELKITTGTTSMSMGDTFVFTTNKKGTKWISSNPSVVSVDLESGLVIARASGTGMIKAVNGIETVIRVITVHPVPSTTALSITSQVTTLTLGEAAYVTSNKANTKWMSSNPSILSVQESTGLLTPKEIGIATIYALNGTETAAVPITVIKRGSTEELQITSTIRNLQVGSYHYLASNKAGTKWFSSNDSILTVDMDTGLLFAKSYGSATIFAVCGSETVTLLMDVTEAGGTIRITSDKTTFIHGTYTYLTANQTGIIWTSSDTAIVTIDPSTGLLYAKGTGKAVIYARTAAQMAYVTVEVIPASYTADQIITKTNAVNAISNIPNEVTIYNLDAVKTYLSLAKDKIHSALAKQVDLRDIVNYQEYLNALQNWLQLEKVPGTTTPLAIQKASDLMTLEAAISAMYSAIATSTTSQRLIAVNVIETSILKAVNIYLMEPEEISNYAVYLKERTALGLL